MMRSFWKFLTLAALVCIPMTTQAQTTIALPDTSQTSIITALVSEQATINLPSIITFNVTDIAATTTTTAALSVTNIVTATALKQVRLSVQANAANFTPPVAGATTWAAGAVSWGAGVWSNAVGSAGILSSSSFSVVALGVAGVGSLSVASLPLTLAANPSVTRAGSHTLVVTWKVESM